MIAHVVGLSAGRRGRAPRSGEAIEIGDRALHRALDGTADKLPVERSEQTRPRLELDREKALESIARGREVPFMACVRQPVLWRGSTM